MSRLRKPSSNKPYISELDIFTTYSNPHKIEFLDFKLICKTFFYLLTKYAVDHGDVYYLPSRLGTFGVRKKQAIGRGYFNYALYAAEGIKQWKMNPHSSGYVARFIWDKKTGRYNVALPKTIEFKGCRDLLRYGAKKIKEDNSILKYYDY